MNKKQYLKERAELLAQMKTAIDAGDAAQADELHKKVLALDEKFHALATAAANLAALNGAQAAAVPEVPGVLNAAPIAPVSNEKAEEETLYRQAFAHYMMGIKLSADEDKIFKAKNETTTAKENYVVVPTTMREGIWHEMEELHPIIADTIYTKVPGDVDILIETSVGEDAAWCDEDDEVAGEKATFTKATLKGCELAKDIPVSWKLKKMSVDDFIAYIQSRIAEKMGNALAKGLVSGAGVDPDTVDPDPTEPVGVITKLEAESDTPQVVTYTAGNGIAYAMDHDPEEKDIRLIKMSRVIVQFFKNETWCEEYLSSRAFGRIAEKMTIYLLALIIFFGFGKWCPEFHLFGVNVIPKDVFPGIICTVLFLIEVSSLNENLIELGYKGVSEYVQRFIDALMDRIAPRKEK